MVTKVRIVEEYGAFRIHEHDLNNMSFLTPWSVLYKGCSPVTFTTIKEADKYVKTTYLSKIIKEYDLEKDN